MRYNFVCLISLVIYGLQRKFDWIYYYIYIVSSVLVSVIEPKVEN